MKKYWADIGIGLGLIGLYYACWRKLNGDPISFWLVLIFIVVVGICVAFEGEG